MNLVSASRPVTEVAWLSGKLEIVRWIIEIMQLRPGETLLNLHTNWKIEKFV